MSSKALPGKPASRSHSLPPLLSHAFLLKSGWCLKESGSSFLGSKNWRRRLFLLTEFSGNITLSYFKSPSDDLPAGVIPLDRTYATRHIELTVKGKMHCFAVGPLVEDGSSRTYYICCLGDLEKKEWMTAIDAAIEGVPDEAARRMHTLRSRSMARARKPHADSSDTSGSELEEISPSIASSNSNTMDTEIFDKHMSIMLGVECSDLSLPSPTAPSTFEFPSEHLDTSASLPAVLPASSIISRTRDHSIAMSLPVQDDEDDLDFEDETGSVYDNLHQKGMNDLSSPLHSDDYLSSRWRLEQWRAMKHKLVSTHWKKVDSNNDITIARTKFSSQLPVLIKLEGTLEADPQIAMEYFKNALKVGGNFDFPFRNENILEHIQSEPEAVVIQNSYHVPIPHMHKRELTALRFWVPSYLDEESCSGMLVTRISHKKSVKLCGVERVILFPSGLILRPISDGTGRITTHCTVLIQLNVRGSLQRMFKTAYNSGLLKLGLRSVFSQLKQHLQVFVNAIQFV